MTCENRWFVDAPRPERGLRTAEPMLVVTCSSREEAGFSLGVADFSLAAMPLLGGDGSWAGAIWPPPGFLTVDTPGEPLGVPERSAPSPDALAVGVRAMTMATAPNATMRVAPNIRPRPDHGATRRARGIENMAHYGYMTNS